MKEVEVMTELKKGIVDLRDTHGLDYTHSKILIKVIDKNYHHYGYAWIGDSNLYNCIIGNNPDGSSRTQLVYPKALSEFEPEMNTDHWDDLTMDERWDEMCNFYTGGFEEALETITKYEELAYVEELDPLFEMENISNFDAAYIKSDSGMSNKFTAYNVPRNVTTQMISAIFSDFVSDPTAHLFNKKTKESSYYPIITEDKRKRTIRVSFNPRSMDGYFALLLNKVCVLNDNTKLYFSPDSSESCTNRY